MTETMEQLGSTTEMFECAIYDLAERMRTYDSLAHTEHQLLSDLSAYDAKLDTLDPTIDLEEQPEFLARAALGHYITGQKVSDIASQLHTLDIMGDPFRFRHLIMGERATVTTQYPGRYTIGTSRRNEYGSLDGLRKWHLEKTGRIYDVKLDPQTGGTITLTGRGNRYYSATPLVSRENGYVPAFHVAL